MNQGYTPSPRAKAVTLRTYQRPLDDQGASFEAWDVTITRAQYNHHKALWERYGCTRPNEPELQELLELGRQRKSLVAGRTLWLGGTDYAYERACCNFNCSALPITTVYDVVDATWLLLNGCGVGFKPKVGVLHGFRRPITKVTVVPSQQDATWKGQEDNVESYDESDESIWKITIGDSAAAWAKAVGKLFNPRHPCVDELILDFSNVRGPGQRLKGYGWICNGSVPLANAMLAIVQVLNGKAGELLDEIDILDCVNHIGTVLSSRRSAQICLMDATNPRIKELESAKHEYWKRGNNHRRQSNNTEQFWSKPTKQRLAELLHYSDRCGGDPGLCNADAARHKAPWYEAQNPCSEILLPYYGFCNLVTNCLPLFERNFAALERAIYLIARANFRQTCVDLRDGILQPVWHQANEALRLCGVSLTGIVQAPWVTDYQIRRLRNAAIVGAYSMADEWKLPRPKAVTTIKPEGTGTKCMGTKELGEVSEGVHRPLGKFIFNWINFSQHDPIVGIMESAGYRTLPNPSDTNNVLVCFPVTYDNVTFDRVNGKEVNLEPATAQLNRYLRWNNLWADHTVSCTVSYQEQELPEIVDWIDDNWDRGFISSSFLRRGDPTKSAKELGHPYLPQDIVDEPEFRSYEASLRSVDFNKVTGIFELDSDECKGGACPVR